MGDLRNLGVASLQLSQTQSKCFSKGQKYEKLHIFMLQTFLCVLLCSCVNGETEIYVKSKQTFVRFVFDIDERG